MPGTSGINVLEWMYEMKMDIPVIIITGYGSEEIALEAWEVGGEGLFCKRRTDIAKDDD